MRSSNDSLRAELVDRIWQRWRLTPSRHLANLLWQFAGRRYSERVGLTPSQLEPPLPDLHRAALPLVEARCWDPEPLTLEAFQRWHPSRRRSSRGWMTELVASPAFPSIQAWWMDRGWDLELDQSELQRSPAAVARQWLAGPGSGARAREAAARLALPIELLLEHASVDWLRRKSVVTIGQHRNRRDLSPKVRFAAETLGACPGLEDAAEAAMASSWIPGHARRLTAQAFARHHPERAETWALRRLHGEPWDAVVVVVAALAERAEAEALCRRATRSANPLLAFHGCIGDRGRTAPDGCRDPLPWVLWHGRRHAEGDAASARWLTQRFESDPVLAVEAIAGYRRRADAPPAPLRRRLNGRFGRGDRLCFLPGHGAAVACAEGLVNEPDAFELLTSALLRTDTEAPRGIAHCLEWLLEPGERQQETQYYQLLRWAYGREFHWSGEWDLWAPRSSGGPLGEGS